MWTEYEVKTLWSKVIKDFKEKHPVYSAKLREAKVKPIVIHKRANYFGRCDYNKRTISINMYLHKNSKEVDIVDTMLHEIAHAIDFTIRSKSNHDQVWSNIAKEIGCNGKRSSKVPVKVDYAYVTCVKTFNNLVFVKGHNRKLSKIPVGKYLEGCYIPSNITETKDKLIVYPWKMWLYHCKEYGVSPYREDHKPIKDFIDN
jgi:predicted SprT family Zn-dependent metalloprotease